MVKKAALFALAVAIGAAGVYGLGGRRIAFDGSAWPRLVSSEANYDALEADGRGSVSRPGPLKQGGPYQVRRPQLEPRMPRPKVPGLLKPINPGRQQLAAAPGPIMPGLPE